MESDLLIVGNSIYILSGYIAFLLLLQAHVPPILSGTHKHHKTITHHS